MLPEALTDNFVCCIMIFEQTILTEMECHEMYKELLSTDRIGMYIDLDQWGFGFEVFRNMAAGLHDNSGILLSIHIVCLHIDIALN